MSGANGVAPTFVVVGRYLSFCFALKVPPTPVFDGLTFPASVMLPGPPPAYPPMPIWAPPIKFRFV